MYPSGVRNCFENSKLAPGIADVEPPVNARIVSCARPTPCTSRPSLPRPVSSLGWGHCPRGTRNGPSCAPLWDKRQPAGQAAALSSPLVATPPRGRGVAREACGDLTARPPLGTHDPLSGARARCRPCTTSPRHRRCAHPPCPVAPPPSAAQQARPRTCHHTRARSWVGVGGGLGV